MNKLDYSVFDLVYIVDYDLISEKNSLIFTYCMRNKIFTLGDLLRKYDNNEIIFKNKKSEEEIRGFIDLVKYRHFGRKIPNENLVFSQIIF